MQTHEQYRDLPLIEQVHERIFTNASAKYGSVNQFLNADPEAHERAYAQAVEQVIGSMEQ